MRRRSRAVSKRGGDDTGSLSSIGTLFKGVFSLHDGIERFPTSTSRSIGFTREGHEPPTELPTVRRRGTGPMDRPGIGINRRSSTGNDVESFPSVRFSTDGTFDREEALDRSERFPFEPGTERWQRSDAVVRRRIARSSEASELASSRSLGSPSFSCATTTPIFQEDVLPSLEIKKKEALSLRRRPDPNVEPTSVGECTPRRRWNRSGYEVGHVRHRLRIRRRLAWHENDRASDPDSSIAMRTRRPIKRRRDARDVRSRFETQDVNEPVAVFYERSSDSRPNVSKAHRSSFEDASEPFHDSKRLKKEGFGKQRSRSNPISWRSSSCFCRSFSSDTSNDPSTSID